MADQEKLPQSKFRVCDLCHVKEADWDYRFCRRCKKVLCYDCSIFTNTDRVFCKNYGARKMCLPNEGDDDYDPYD